jgi:hypothetical protein
VESSAVGEAIRPAVALPAIESFHLLGLAVIGGSVLVVNLRLWASGSNASRLQNLARHQALATGQPDDHAGFGFCCFTQKPQSSITTGRLDDENGFVVVGHYLHVHRARKVALADQGRVTPFWSKAAALISILLWSGVGVGGRWIGFS